jgi:hypothetical protein
MVSRSAWFLGVLALVACAGCASGGAGPSSGGDPAAHYTSPALPEVLDCRGRGVYNRAANLCVSEGP